MNDHISKVEETTGIKITRVKPERSFEYLMLEHHIVCKDGTSKIGFSWAGSRQRWCTSRLKDEPREKFLRPLRKEYDVVEHVGIAVDEQFLLNENEIRARATFTRLLIGV